MAVCIPEKLYFKIGEVAEITGLKPHVLRYWETEFKIFRPGKSRTQQRLYRREDIELVLRIKDLLYVQGFTIAGAIKKLKEKPAEIDAQPLLEQGDIPELKSPETLLQDVRRDLVALRDSLCAKLHRGS